MQETIRSMMRLMSLAAAALGSLQCVAHADARPQTMPTRDVDVTYQMAAPGPNGAPQMLTQRSRWDTQDGLMRVDPPSPGIFTIMNYREHKLMVVREADQSVIIMHTGSASVAPGVSRVSQFQRLGNDTVAGLGCTDWQTQDSAGRPSVVCLTDDGVLLRAKSGSQVLVQAVRVAYGSANPSLFAAPAGYRSMSPPQ